MYLLKREKNSSSIWSGIAKDHTNNCEQEEHSFLVFWRRSNQTVQVALGSTLGPNRTCTNSTGACCMLT